jgi:hypothetical protein
MNLKRTIFTVEIAGVTYRFAECTMREIESLVKTETEAFESKDYAKVKQVHFDFVLSSLNSARAPGDEPLTEDHIKDGMGAATFNSLYASILGAQGVKLEAKNLGESKPSQAS